MIALPPPPPALAEPDWAAFVALDWGDQTVEAWAVELSRRFANRPIAVCLEQAHGSLVFLLMKYAQLVLHPVHPPTSARYREASYPSGAKDHPVDADLLMEILRRHRERLRRLDPDTTQTRTLPSLVQERRALVNERTRQENRLTARLKLYYPQVLEWFEDVASPLVLDLLQRWPTVEDLQGHHPGTLRRFFHPHNCRSEKRRQIALLAGFGPAGRSHPDRVEARRGLL
ncbi:MAG: transposase [Bryobacteraceae bacterium]